MKIDQTPHMPRMASATVAPAAAKDGPPVQATRAAAVEAAAAKPSQDTVLPSVQGDFDARRVERIRADIGAGRYKVDTSKIADGLLATVRDLLGSGR